MNAGLSVLSLSAAAVACCATAGRVALSDDAERLTSPSTAELESAVQQVRGSYAAFYQEFRSPLDRDELACRLLSFKDDADDNNAVRFATLAEARTLAVQAGAVQTSLRAVEQMIRSFDVDPWDERVELVRQLSKALSHPEQHLEFVDRFSLILDQALDEERYEAGLEIGAALLDSARGSGDTMLLRRMAARNSEIKAVLREHAATQEALVTLQQSPSDRAANLVVGRFRCFFQGDWEEGLPLLANCEDGALRELAARTLTGADTPDDWLRIGDDWWDMSRKESGVAQQSMRERAVTAYREAVGGLTGGRKSRAQGRIDELSRGALSLAGRQGVIPPERIIGMFRLDPVIWKAEAGVLHGRAGDDRFVAEPPIAAPSFRYAYSVKSPQYQMIFIKQGDDRHEYSRGHWLNTGSSLRAGKEVDRRRGREFVHDPDDWHTLAVRCDRGSLSFFYDGLLVGQSRLAAGGGPVQLGFGSYMAPVAIRNMSFSTER